jgi:hypothetical protein
MVGSSLSDNEILPINLSRHQISYLPNRLGSPLSCMRALTFRGTLRLLPLHQDYPALPIHRALLNNRGGTSINSHPTES